MVNVYTINIQNDSGSDQTYAVFNAVPKVKTDVNQPSIWSNVFATADTPHTEPCKFEIFEQWTAQIGTSQGSPAEGVVVSVQGNQLVTLGYLDDQGKQVAGTSKEMYAPGGKFPQFQEPDPTPAGDEGAFQFVTSSDFTVQEATDGNWMIGIGGMTDPTGKQAAPAALFSPQPNAQYQIQPVVTFYVTFGTYTSSTLVNIQEVGTQTLMVNFTELGKDTVNVEHNAHGELVILS
ncbi:hypothetical protein BCR34DRAFT_593793 [Clohesyomyces aquaticus]|uniref:Uncharacterized protein n=1 Tax=Clohesyomyces aquaticus TaxID=1231657 RepID=A0A1Y1YF51_9PLEO|nr:hypothetical protein BCR34DRAFT_593793 [Clohesyomyces aquaticus]